MIHAASTDRGRHMAFAFDTLGYAKRLRDAGIPRDQADAHAEAAREFIMTELVTKQDLDIRLHGVEAAMQTMELRLENRIDSLELRLMVRLGGILAVAVAILAAIIKF
jgi:hypothetical protein